MSRLTVRWRIVLIGFCIQVNAFALPSDKTKMIKVLADSARLSQKEHKGTYKGQVELIQGTTHLNAARAETYADDKNHLTLAMAWGDKNAQVHYRTKTDPEKPMFHAYADKITYYPLKNRINLTGDVKIVQGKNAFFAEEMTYDTMKQQVLSESGQHNRSKIVIYPDNDSNDHIRSKTFKKIF